LLIGILTFLSLFVYFYKTSGKFRKSICAALVAAFVLASGPLESEAKGADAFTPQQQNTHSQRHKSFSSGAAKKPSNNNNGPGKPSSGGDDNDGIPEYPKVESVEETQKHLENIDEYIRRMEESSNSESEEDQCPIHEQNKAGIDELPDSSEYIYTLETKTAKKALKKVWKNPNAQQEVLEALRKIDKGELLPRNQKDFKGFKSLKELKFSNTRMLMQPGKDGEPDKIVVICMRRDLDDLVPKLRKKYE
jgi:hypothetical protein